MDVRPAAPLRFLSSTYLEYLSESADRPEQSYTPKTDRNSQDSELACDTVVEERV